MSEVTPDTKRPVTGWNGRAWDFETTFLPCVGEGWRPMVLKLYDDLVELGWNRQLYQVKEKWGGLRFYIGAATGAAHDRIEQAEEESYKTCEECGAPGRVRSTGWVKTLCDAHTPPGTPDTEPPKPLTFTFSVEEKE